MSLFGVEGFRPSLEPSGHWGLVPRQVFPCSLLPRCLLLPRPLASTVNDKLELQECLEHGRIAKVSLSTQDTVGVGGGVDGRVRWCMAELYTTCPFGMVWEQ